MTADDYDSVIELMKRTPGISVRDADSRESTLRYLERNPGLSFVAQIGDRLGASRYGNIIYSFYFSLTVHSEPSSKCDRVLPP